jgi:AraC-like DNA-binding protein
MKPFLEKLNIGEKNSFYVKTHSTPLFEVGWHQHPELELIYFKEGNGSTFIGDHIGQFSEGDVYLLGQDLAHTFKKDNNGLFVSAVVVQFKEDFLGEYFLSLPEAKGLRTLFEQALHGLKIQGICKQELAKGISALEGLNGLARVMQLLQCLLCIEGNKEFEVLSSSDPKKFNAKKEGTIYKIFDYTHKNYYDAITLDEVANIASMSIPAFCNYFKKCTRKTYIEYLNEVRIENACKLLIDSEKSINEIGFNSGYNTLPNFNRQFFKLKKMTPSHYRKLFQKNSVLL